MNSMANLNLVLRCFSHSFVDMRHVGISALLVFASCVAWVTAICDCEAVRACDDVSSPECDEVNLACLWKDREACKGRALPYLW